MQKIIKSVLMKEHDTILCSRNIINIKLTWNSMKQLRSYSKWWIKGAVISADTHMIMIMKTDNEVPSSAGHHLLLLPLMGSWFIHIQVSSIKLEKKRKTEWQKEKKISSEDCERKIITFRGTVALLLHWVEFSELFTMTLKLFWGSTVWYYSVFLSELGLTGQSNPMSVDETWGLSLITEHFWVRLSVTTEHWELCC